MRYRRPHATRTNTRIIPILALVFSLLTLWTIRHVITLIAIAKGNHINNLEYIYALAFIFLTWTTILAVLDRPKVVNKRQQAKLNKLHVVACIPAYNEDPKYLKDCIYSIMYQSRKPNHIFVVDDGSNLVDYSEVKKWARIKSKQAGIKFSWKRTENRGKRHAQHIAIKNTPKADVYLTVDSDGILDKQAIKEGLKPFINDDVKSVAGVVMSINSQKNLLTRFTDLWFVMGQLVDRSSMSTMGSVLVNCGPLAFYRADMVRRNLNGYINETFFGKSVEFSDDSMLTLYALKEGLAVQQTTSFAFTVMPETISHHIRQYLRWMRGAFIRTFWRFKYLPLSSYGYWNHILAWFQMFVSLTVFVSLFIYTPLLTREILPSLLLVPILVGYGQALFYLTIKRNDMKFRSQFLIYLTALPAALWAYFVLRFVRWYGILTCRKTGWGTREVIEVKAS